MCRPVFLKHTAVSLVSMLSVCSTDFAPAYALQSNNSGGGAWTRGDIGTQSQDVGIIGENDAKRSMVAYRSLSIDMPGFGVKVPAAIWYPIEKKESLRFSSEKEGSPAKMGKAVYSHRISVRKIGELLVGWEFIPEFVSKEFNLVPAMNELDDTAEFVVDGQNIELPKSSPVVFLAHGYLGSRFDLSHLAEQLARQGFICVSPEYPESLSSSYPRLEGLNREKITNRLLNILESEFAMKPTSYGIIGHSLGCGTAASTGDETWTRVYIAGRPSTVKGPSLFIASTNDGAVTLDRVKGSLPLDYVELDESIIHDVSGLNLPKRAALIFMREDAPNHISFLADSTNNAMIDLLSPLLPIAQMLSIPVLDFDKYQISRDSKKTADVLVPLVTLYLKQNML